MADKKEKAEALEKAQKAIEAVQGIDPHLAHWADNSSRTLGLGKEGMPRAELGRLLNAYQRLTPGVLGGLPVEELQRIHDFATETSELLSKFDNARDALSNRSVHHGYRPDLAEEVNKLRELCKSSLPVIQGYADRAIELEETKREVESLLADMHGQQEELTAAVKETKAAAAETKASFQQETRTMREEVTQLGVSLHAAFFKREADRHVKSSIGWGFGALAFAALLVVYAFFGDRWISIQFPERAEWTPEATYVFARAAITRILGFAVFGYGLFFCAKNYTAHRHNAVVNRHRQNALSTYRALVKGNKDPGSADIVLTQAARFIYAPQDSGYGRGGGADGGDVSVFETVRRAADLAKKRDGDE